MDKAPCSSRCWPSCHAVGKRPLLHGIFFFSSRTRRGYINRGCCPAGILPSGHAGRYSSCHCQASVSRLANLSKDCQMVCPFLLRSRKLWKTVQGLSEEAQCIQGAILNGTSWLLRLLSTLSGTRISSSHQFLSLLVYLSERF